MITSLSLSGLGVISSAELDLGPGLTVLTGETGAGKTMVVTSLQLLLGQRASADVVRSGASQARVTAVMDVPSGPDSPDSPDSPFSGALDRVRSAGGDVEDQAIIAVRVIASSGRSRAALGGAAVPVGVLAEVGADLVAVHGQHDQGRLMAPARQRELLDRYADHAELVAQVASSYHELVALHHEQRELVERRQDRLREIDALGFGLKEVQAVAPIAGEDVELQAEELRLAHAVELKLAAASAGDALDHNDQAVTVQLAAVQRALDAVREHDPALDSIAARLHDVGYVLADLASDLTSYEQGIEADPERLASVQERRSTLGALQRKYGPGVDHVLAWADEAQLRLAELSGADDRLGELEKEVSAAATGWGAAALELSESRRAAATQLSALATAELTGLAMPDAELVVEVAIPEVGGHITDADDGRADVLLPDGRGVHAAVHGLDDVSFLLRPHAGAPLTPLQRGASGGERSRVMLAIDVVLADADPIPTVVFDEVDAGVGGEAAVEVGRRLARLGKSRQVLVVTHLPQVAAFAHRHWVVTKESSGDVTESGVTELDDSSRVRELTRMLAGLSDSVSGQAHAEELLALARDDA